MASQDEKLSFAEKALGTGERIFNTLWNTDPSPDLWHWILLIFLIFTTLSIVLILLKKVTGDVIEILAKLTELYKASGLPVWLNNDNKKKVRRRKQFCKVLNSDLAHLAKAENWNDQHFTDLEAEVETEGGYYASAIDRLRRKKSYGLRKERSLIRAIKSSTERAMQLVGEPGSGKSVALRHLAMQLAVRGQTSNEKNATVPLYINLREMDITDLEKINADSVREFVLDNIRRGDADTAAYVKENWDDYCNRGQWLFLFDSFDEIPAVMHSAAGSNIIRHYSQAIRHFLQGMGECKGILASREFKGPEALPWKKLRILPLSVEKQDELIRNSFLNEQQMDLARQHLASSRSSIGATPLFLTLLCRYVRDEQRAPANDHDILLQHIERLARREPEYLQRKYGLTPEQLIAGAERLARLFAENDTMSLAPTLDQIVKQLPASDIPGGQIERLISALVDSKIGRADVPNAAQGDRRFAFAHRRYQEALFVHYLTVHPDILSAAQLLTETRWREYTVTLLQTCDAETIQDLLDHASIILHERAAMQIYNACGHYPLPENLTYFDWSSDSAIPVLGLLQDGLEHRPGDVPEKLSLAVEAFLKPRWENGDTRDRCEVLRYGGLLPQETLVDYLVDAFNHGTEQERLHAFRLTRFTTELPKTARTAVLKMLSVQVISARDRSEQLTVEALAARLPLSLGARFVVSRGKKLRRHFIWAKRIVSLFSLRDVATMVGRFLPRPLERMGFQSIFSFDKTKDKDFLDAVDIVFFIFMLTMICAFCLTLFINKPSIVNIFALILTTLVLLFSCFVFSPYLVRHYGNKLTFYDATRWMTANLFTLGYLKLILKIIFGSALACIFCSVIGYATHWFTNKYMSPGFLYSGVVTPGVYIFTGFVIATALFYIFLLFQIIIKGWANRQQRIEYVKKLSAMKNAGYPDVQILYSSQNYEQSVFWLQYDADLMTNEVCVRTFSSFILSVLRIEKIALLQPELIRPACLKSHIPKTEETTMVKDLTTLRQLLERRLMNNSR
ncbi:NACHT domain-containing protein [Enterobacter roggenkampii]|uniref:NACHT domain-containing protein n=1 Tax=Enterobacter roggenkampii TaxID=1812935 RepID=UPI002DB9FF9A|nr:NACHT domain-containing protein [Enterobacter roggenkampii]MEB5888639.1 NACHT domain-containing protein [Enterobacter roggenkampii]